LRLKVLLLAAAHPVLPVRIARRAVSNLSKPDFPKLVSTMAKAPRMEWISADGSSARPAASRWTGPALAAAALLRAQEVGHRGSRSELLRYLQRAGHDVEVPPDPLGPWAPALAGRPLESAAAWAALGERYEEAVERALSGVAAERDRGRAALREMGAIATLSRL